MAYEKLNFTANEVLTATKMNKLVACLEALKDGSALDELIIYTKHLTDGSVTEDKLADGSVTHDKIAPGAISMDTLDVSVLFENPQSHNGFFRGKDLTDIYTLEEISKRVQDGSFKDLYIGDYITKSVTHGSVTEEIDFVIAGFDYFLGNGDTELTKHHIVFVPRSCFNTTEQMNASNVVTGGYKGSAMYKTNLAKYRTAITNAFGSSHVVSHRRLLTKTTNDSYYSMGGANWKGCSTDWEWTDAVVELMTEPMVYGCHPMSSSRYDIGDGQMQLPLFTLAPNYKIARLGKAGARQWWWLAAVAGASTFCYAGHSGVAGDNTASNAGGVRPYFLFA